MLNFGLFSTNLQSSRWFGFGLCINTVVLAVWQFEWGKPVKSTILVITPLLFLLITLYHPNLFHVPNKLFFTLVTFASKQFNKMIMLQMYYLIFTPYSIVMRLLVRRKQSITNNIPSSYWIFVEKPTYDSQFFQKQY
jgi:hypothetical protein